MTVPLGAYIAVSRGALLHRMRGRPRAAQRRGHPHVRRADAERRQPRARRLLAKCGSIDERGSVFVVFVFVIAAAEVAVGLGIILSAYRNRPRGGRRRDPSDEGIVVRTGGRARLAHPRLPAGRIPDQRLLRAPLARSSDGRDRHRRGGTLALVCDRRFPRGARWPNADRRLALPLDRGRRLPRERVRAHRPALVGRCCSWSRSSRSSSSSTRTATWSTTRLLALLHLAVASSSSRCSSWSWPTTTS